MVVQCRIGVSGIIEYTHRHRPVQYQKEEMEELSSVSPCASGSNQQSPLLANGVECAHKYNMTWI